MVIQESSEAAIVTVRYVIGHIYCNYQCSLAIHPGLEVNEFYHGLSL